MLIILQFGILCINHIRTFQYKVLSIKKKRYILELPIFQLKCIYLGSAGYGKSNL